MTSPTDRDQNRTEIFKGTDDLTGPDWNLAKRMAFRFAFSYLVLYNLPFPIDSIPYVERVAEWHSKFINALVLWVGKHVFHLTIIVLPTGSGDTTFDYVQIFCQLFLAIIATLVWTLLDRRRKQYQWLYDWLRVYVRYALALTMLSYGIGKLLKLQMPFPSLNGLLEPYGDSSPATLLWNFMGYSSAYEIFAGAAETIGGLLLLFRRTTTLGAIVVAGVMLNVAMMNYCFDIPVKISSTHLFLIALFLLLPDLRGLANFLVLRRTSMPAKLGRPFTTRWMNIGRWAVKAIFVGSLIYTNLHISMTLRKQVGDYAPKSSLYGIYQVEEFTKNGQILPPLTTDANRWDKVIFQRPQSMQVRSMPDSAPYSGKYYHGDIDTAKNIITFSNHGKKDVFTYTQPDPDHLILQGTLAGDSFLVKTQRIDSKMLLVTRGYHWINESALYK